MSWTHDVPEDNLYDHEGYTAAVLADGTEPGPTDAGTVWYVYDGTKDRPLAAAVRAACECGWRSASTFPIDWDDWEGTEGYEYNDGPFKAWQTEHIGSLLGTVMPADLSEALHTVARIVEQLTTERPIVALTAIAKLERLTAHQAPLAGVAARQKGITWDTIGKAIGATRQAAFQRFGRHLPASDD